MKHLSKFNENTSQLKLTWVDFTGGSDGIHALYINDKLERYGDYYHNKIEDWYKGFKDGLVYANFDFIEEEIRLPNSNIWVERTSELGDSPPETLFGLSEDPDGNFLQGTTFDVKRVNR